MGGGTAIVDDGPGWRIQGPEGELEIKLSPGTRRTWGQLQLGHAGRVIEIAPATPRSTVCSVPVQAASGDFVVEARRGLANWASFRSSPAFVRAVLMSSLFALFSLAVGIGVGVAIVLITRAALGAAGVTVSVGPLGVPGIAVGVGLLLALVPRPFANARDQYTEYRLLQGDTVLGGWLVTEVGDDRSIEASDGNALDRRGLDTIPVWPGGPAFSVKDGQLIGSLLTPHAETSMKGFWSGDLWLLPDGLLFVAHSALSSFFSTASPGVPSLGVRAFDPAEVDRLAATSHCRRTRWAEVRGATISGSDVVARIDMELQEGSARTYFWKAPIQETVDALEASAREALGPRLKRESDPNPR